MNLNVKLRNKTGGAKQKSGGDMAHPGPPLESPLHGSLATPTYRLLK